jgi:hypothetical protein
MKPDQALFDAIFRSKVQHAARTTPEQRLLTSLRLADASLEIMRSGVRDKFPGAADHEIEQRLAEQMRLVRRIGKRL